MIDPLWKEWFLWKTMFRVVIKECHELTCSILLELNIVSYEDTPIVIYITESVIKDLIFKQKCQHH